MSSGEKSPIIDTFKETHPQGLESSPVEIESHVYQAVSESAAVAVQDAAELLRSVQAIDNAAAAVAIEHLIASPKIGLGAAKASIAAENSDLAEIKDAPTSENRGSYVPGK